MYFSGGEEWSNEATMTLLNSNSKAAGSDGQAIVETNEWTCCWLSDSDRDHQNVLIAFYACDIAIRLDRVEWKMTHCKSATLQVEEEIIHRDIATEFG